MDTKQALEIARGVFCSDFIQRQDYVSNEDDEILVAMTATAICRSHGATDVERIFNEASDIMRREREASERAAHAKLAAEQAENRRIASERPTVGGGL